jgi:hypothetical protein
MARLRLPRLGLPRLGLPRFGFLRHGWSLLRHSPRLPGSPRPRLGRIARLALLAVSLGGSLLMLFRPISEPVTREGEWAMVALPLLATRCRAPTRGEAQWRVEVPAEFACLGLCSATVVAEVRPSWLDRPHFLSGFGRLTVPVVLRRQVGQCADVFEMTLDARIDEGIRGSDKLAQLHTGQMIGGFFRQLQAAEQPWPGR